MHLVSSRKEANTLLRAGRRQKSAMTGQRDLLLPDDHSLASLPCVIPGDKLFRILDYDVTSDSVMTLSSSLKELLSPDPETVRRSSEKNTKTYMKPPPSTQFS